MRSTPSDRTIREGIADELPVGIWVARAPRGEFVYANESFTEIMGLAPIDGVVAGTYAEPYGIHLPSGELYPEDRMPFVRALQAKATVTVDDIVIHRRDGRKVPVRAFARPIFDAAGEITHVIVAFTDISREAEAEARLRRAQRMESIGTLAGGIAHDFNNLLAAVRIITSGLAATEVDAHRRAELERVNQIGERAGELIRALLGFAGRGKNRSEPLALNDVVRSILAIVERTLDRRIELHVELGGEMRDAVGDFSQLEQVLMNLVVNARDAMPEGGRLGITTKDPGGDPPRLILEVSDTGHGIDPELRDRIFEPYFTTKGTTTGGSGLGLATVYGIVEAHGGDIEVATNAPHGTIMRVALPASATRTVRPAVAAPVHPAIAPGKGTVLLVEDEVLVRNAVGRSLEVLGYTVLAAEDGLAALELFKIHGKDILAVILDMVMPKMDGRATFLELSRLDPDVRVLLTTGNAHNDEVQEILDLGVRAFIGKPYDVATLSSALARLIRGS